MTRLNSASSFTDLAHGVYERSNVVTRYIDGPDIDFDTVMQLLDSQNSGDQLANDFIIVPPELESLSLQDWDKKLMAAYEQNERRKNTAEFIAGPKIAGLIIHNAFTRHMPNLQPRSLVDVSVLQSAERMTRTPVSFAAYVVGSLSVSFSKGKTDSKKVTFPGIEPVLFENEEYDTTASKKLLNGSTATGARIIKKKYDTATRADQMVVPVARLVPMGTDRPVDVTRPVIRYTRWTGDGVKVVHVDDTPENRTHMPVWEQRGYHVFTSQISQSHMAISVTPRPVRTSR